MQLSIVRFAYKLSMKALNPSTFERQNVNLTVRVLNDFFVQALVDLGSKHNTLLCHDTSVGDAVASSTRENWRLFRKTFQHLGK